MRTAIYARFSSDLQDNRSIADQIALARKYAETRGLSVAGIYEDAAISGSSVLNRPGLMRLMADAEAKRFDVLVTESIDRLSHSQADIAALYERLTFLGIRVETLADGAVSEIHVGLKGTMAALFLKDLAQKTRRGQVGRVKAGRIPGGKSYGYDVVHKGEERGLRAINDAEADVVRRIFREYAEGKGTLSIVADLNAEGIAGPRGRWSASALLGSPKRRNGLLNNELYKGTIVYNRQRFLKDPATGKRIARDNPESEWYRQEVPELRIVDEDVWAKVQAKRSERGGGPHLDHRRRPKWLLSGLLKCGCCGGSYSIVNKDFLRCSTLTNSRGCDNMRLVKTGHVEERIMVALNNHLLDPDVVAAAVEAYRKERHKLDDERRRRRNDLTRDLGAVERKLKHVMDMVMDGHPDRKTLGRKLQELEAEQERLVAELAVAPSADSVAVHPQAAERYRQKVAEIHQALRQGDNAAHTAIQILRELIDHIVVIPTPKPDPVRLQVVGNLAALLVCSDPVPEITGSVVAGACNGRYRTNCSPLRSASRRLAFPRLRFRADWVQALPLRRCDGSANARARQLRGPVAFRPPELCESQRPLPRTAQPRWGIPRRSCSVVRPQERLRPFAALRQAG